MSTPIPFPATRESLRRLHPQLDPHSMFEVTAIRSKVQASVLQAMPDKLLTVTSLPTPTEAEIVRSRLDLEGIRSFLSGENLVGINWILGNAVVVADNVGIGAASMAETAHWLYGYRRA